MQAWGKKKKKKKERNAWETPGARQTDLEEIVKQDTQTKGKRKSPKAKRR